MRCDMCQAEEASIHIHEVADGNEKIVNLCPVCAEANGVLRTGSDDITIGDLCCDVTIKAVVKPLASVPADASAPDTVCPGCGLSARLLASGGRLGCRECYATFAEQVTAIIGRTQRGPTHVGGRPREPRPASPPAARLGALHSELARAVAVEAYEKAAELRDAIRQLGGRCKDPAEA